MNLCYNNQILRSSGDVTDLADFLTYRTKVAPATARPIKARYFDHDVQPADVAVIPVTDVGEGEVESCIAIVATSTGRSLVPKGRPEFSCIGFAIGEKELADKISQRGLETLQFGEREQCLNTSKMALLPW